MSFEFDATNGLLNQRTNHITSQNETFDYDSHYRLTNVTTNGSIALSMTYDSDGNILNKSDINPSQDSYLYESDKIHALTSIRTPDHIRGQNQSISYNSSHQPTSITDGMYKLDYDYGLDEQRRFASLTNG